MKNTQSRLLLLLSLAGVRLSAAGTDYPNTIVRTENPSGWIIRTKSSAYQIVLTKEGSVKPVFYGPVAQADFLQPNARWSDRIDEIPVRGGLPFKTPALEATFADRVRDVDLKFLRADVTSVDGRPTLGIVQRDRIYPLEVISYIRVFPEYDILEKWVTVKNTADRGIIKIENLMSGSI